MDLRASVRRVRASRLWTPSAAAYWIRHVVPPPLDGLPPDQVSLRAAAAWLARAQDATGDGGISGRYRLAGGWSSSYPETTGYAIPTLMMLSDVLSDDSYRTRAERCVEFLLSVQLPSGAFPALEILDNRTEPSAFNTAQIVHGLHRWHCAAPDPRVLDAIVRAARWVCDVQDDDGAWRQHFYGKRACTYSAHAACWLAELADYTGEARFRTCARRNLEWVLRHRDPLTGWFDCCGFTGEDHLVRRAHTHTIAYTLSGILRMSLCFEATEARDAVRLAAERLMERLERSRTLAGVLNHRWQPLSASVCLTGNAQLALLWLQLAETTGDLRFVSAAFKAIDEVKRAQSLASRNDGIRGGVPGSSPIGGDYVPFAFPNWAAKFFIDALCAKQACLEGLDLATRSPNVMSDDGVASAGRSLVEWNQRGVVVYTTRISPKFAQLASRWRARGFDPALVVIENHSASAARRLLSAVRRRDDDSFRVCRRHRWRCRGVPTMNSPEAIEAIARAQPMVAVNAGAGILRQRVLAVPRLGTLNAHMGILPFYRGVNVAEWAVLNGDPIGCCVFWIDQGIDTGPIIAIRRVDVEGCRSIDDVRARVDENQLDLLDETLRSIVDHGIVPAARSQRLDEGRQFFRMHADLRRLIERRLSRRVEPHGEMLRPLA